VNNGLARIIFRDAYQTIGNAELKRGIPAGIDQFWDAELIFMVMKLKAMACRTLYATACYARQRLLLTSD